MTFEAESWNCIYNCNCFSFSSRSSFYVVLYRIFVSGFFFANKKLYTFATELKSYRVQMFLTRVPPYKYTMQKYIVYYTQTHHNAVKFWVYGVKFPHFWHFIIIYHISVDKRITLLMLYERETIILWKIIYETFLFHFVATYSMHTTQKEEKI